MTTAKEFIKELIGKGLKYSQDSFYSINLAHLEHLIKLSVQATAERIKEEIAKVICDDKLEGICKDEQKDCDICVCDSLIEATKESE